MFNKVMVAIFLTCASSLSAVCDIEHPLIMAELVDIALDNHPSTRKAWWNARRASASLGISRSTYYPTANLEANITHGQDFEFINGPKSTYTAVGADVALRWMLYDYGDRDADFEATRMALLAANWQADAVLQRVIVRVLENAFATLHAQEVLEAALISVTEAERMLDMAQKLNHAGITACTDVYTSQASLSLLRMELAKERANLDIQRGKLASSLGLSADSALMLAPLCQRPIPLQPDVESLMTLAYSCRSDLFAKQARLRESFSRYAQARAGYGPKIYVSGKGGASKMFHDNTDAGQYRIRLNLEYPLFDGFRTCYKTRAALADTQLSAEELSELELEVALDVLTQSRWVQAAREMLPEAEDNLNNAQRAYDGVLDKYRAGKERIAEVSNAHRSLVAARVRYSDTKTRLFVSIANLAYATGTLSPPSPLMEKVCIENQ